MPERLMGEILNAYLHIEMVANRPEMEPEVKTGLSNVEFYGFSDKQKAWIIEYSEIIPAPVDNVRIVKLEENGNENQNWLGSVNYDSGALTIYNAALETKNSTETVASTLDHELVGHECCPFNENNDRLYGSKEAREEAKMHAYEVAQQTDLTDIALNGYHRQLLEQFRSGDISIGRFLRETHAIMAEMRLSEPDTLREIEKQQSKKFEGMAERNPNLVELGFTKILSEKKDGSAETVGIDKTLMQLFKIKSPNELNALIEKRKEFIKQTSPFDQS